MSRVILASHGSLAEGMKSAAKMILGESCEMEAFGLDTWEQPVNILEQIRRIQSEYPEEELIVICDIKGGSVCNCMMELCNEPNICVISGMNLGMVIEVALLSPEVRCKDAITEIIEEAKEGIQYFDSSVIKEIGEEEESDDLW